jgi:UDP-3-O-[3-hydroxymyristoyl] glucosamine N-acyltransferase
MATRLSELATLVVGNVVGDPTLEIRAAAPLMDAGPGDITFIDKLDKAARLAQTQASAVVVPQNFPAAALTMPAILTTDVHRAFVAITTHFRPPRVERRVGVSPAAYVSSSATLLGPVEVHPGAMIGEDVEIGAGSVIHSGARVMAGCKLGQRVTIYPNAVLYEDTLVGDRSVIHANAVLGAHGFGYKLINGQHQLTAQLGHVQVGCDVEIGAGSTIDRGAYGPTVIGDGTKIDNLVMVAHNCHVGKHNILCSQVGIAGSTMTGDYVTLAGQVGIRDHVKIGDNAVVGAKAGVSNDVPAGAHMLGSPAMPEREQKIQFAAMARLPEMRKQLKALEHKVARLSGEEGDAPDKKAA